MSQTILWSVLAAINFIGFIFYYIDKQRAQKHEWRISEKVLLAFIVVGGGLGTFAGAQILHHKTRKPLFVIGNFLGLIWTLVIAYYVYHY